MFEQFKKELDSHSANGYHIQTGKTSKQDSVVYFGSKAGIPNEQYLGYMEQIGAGSFFGGNLYIYNVQEESLRTKMPPALLNNYYPIGDNGTTASFFCVSTSREDLAVYLYDAHFCTIAKLASNFEDWLSWCSKELFSETTYKAYKPIGDFASVLKVIEERGKFSIEMVGYTKELTVNPEEKTALLPRYNRITFKLTKLCDSYLETITCKVHRTGSSLGEQNKAWVKFPVKDLKVGKYDFERYVFDPFNLPFESIEFKYNQSIDLRASFRGNYDEIKKFL